MKRLGLILYVITLAGILGACAGDSAEIDGCGKLIYSDGGCVSPDAGDGGTKD